MKILSLLVLMAAPAFAIEKFEIKELDPQSVDSVLEKIKEKICVMTLRPDTVQVGAGPVLLTWQTERICDSK